MKSRNWVRFFLTNLLIGAAAAIIMGFGLQAGKYAVMVKNADIKELSSLFILFAGWGLIFSVLSQMGFFAYLTVHRFGLGMFKSVRLWNIAQLILIAFGLFDLIYFRYQLFASANESILPYIAVSSLIFFFSLFVAYLKKRDTVKEAFTPALFFMFIVTIIEWFPALRINEPFWLYFMLIPLLVCNAFQIIMLPRYTSGRVQQKEGVPS
ncbi:KinB-signaling pathway activation protein [Metabacillus sp. GX 13764]|uniref:KinB-signaling pathway activation protein n=1 Tax=Metabacillus kandeliae TaxID=2900151 RepID=UPI001E5D26BF|nr:KinB-signaling pathway activation protein [Metabacillus kandeliae]MCD7036618.1 KinB-signaling pathway activation protein [Metabacillus kandeliae]